MKLPVVTPESSIEAASAAAARTKICRHRRRCFSRTASCACRCARFASPTARFGSTTPPARRDTTCTSGVPKLRQPWIEKRMARGDQNFFTDALRAARRRHRRDAFCCTAGKCHARVRARRAGARARDHSRQPQPHRAGADDHRLQVPGEDQRQHRQLGGGLVDRRRGREDAVGDPLGRRHGDGSLDGKEHPPDARVDHPQLGGADRDGADLSVPREGEKGAPKI